MLSTNSLGAGKSTALNDLILYIIEGDTNLPAIEPSGKVSPAFVIVPNLSFGSIVFFSKLSPVASVRVTSTFISPEGRFKVSAPVISNCI